MSKTSPSPLDCYIHNCKKYRHLEYAVLCRLLAEMARAISDRPDWMKVREDLRRAQFFATSVTLGFLETGITDPQLIEAIAVSDLVLEQSKPCHHDALTRRQIGIVREGEGPECGYPLVKPLHFGSIGYLPDERAYAPADVVLREIFDHDGEPHVVMSPVANLGDGVVSRDYFRAFYPGRYGSLAKLYKGTEILKDRDRKRAWKDWPFETRIPGVVNPGKKGPFMVYLPAFLPAHHFGIAPAGADDVRASLDDAPPAPTIPLPTAAALIERPMMLAGEVR